MVVLYRFPVGKNWERLVDSENPDYLVAVKDSQKSLKLLLDDLLVLESVLQRKNSPDAAALPQPPVKKRKLNEYCAVLTANQAAFSAERDGLIQKWNEKTRMFATHGKSGGGANKSFAAMETSTLGQIQQILSNRPRLVARTQIKRSNYEILATSSAEVVDSTTGGLNEVNVNIFDDDDFYHQLLRDLIDRKTNSSSDQSQVGHLFYNFLHLILGTT